MKGLCSHALIALALLLCAGSCGSATSTSNQTATRENGTPAPRKQPPALRLTDEVKPVKQIIDLTVVPEEETFSGVVDIDVTVEKPTSTLWLHGTHLEVSRARLIVDGQTHPLKPFASGSEDFLGFSLDQEVGPAPARIHIEYKGKFDDKDFIGIFRQKEDNRWYLFTQFESLGARRAFPSFDEPRFKIPFQLTLHVPDNQTAASNTPILSEEPAGQGLKTLFFAETKPLPSYLVAFAVGPFDVVDIGTGGRNHIPMRILAPLGKGNQTTYAASVTATLVEQLEKYFDWPYPFEKLDSVAVPHFLGAMENPGLITYASDLILAKPGEDTARSRRSYAGVAAHELAHQWFGNLVTMAWWDDTWLNEAFATWAASKIITAWQPEWNGEISRASSNNGAMRTDSLLSARKIRQPIKSNHDIFSAFDGITYNKGAAVLAMFEAFIGADKFQRAIRNHLAAHAHGNATARDFLDAVAAQSSTEIPDAFATFLDQPGVPLVNLELSCSAGKAILQYRQERFLPAGSDGDDGQRRWQIPLCVKFGDGGKGATRQCTLVKEQSGSIELNSKGCPKWLLGNADSLGYYRVSYSGSLGELLLAMDRKLSGPERIGVIGNVRALIFAGKANLDQALIWLTRLARDRQRELVEQAVSIAASIDDMVPPDLYGNYERYLGRTFGATARRLGFRHVRHDNDDTRLLRTSVFGLIAHHDPVLRKQAIGLAMGWLEDKNSIDADMRPMVLKAAARGGDAELYQTLLNAAKKETDRENRELLIDGLANFQQPELVQQNLEMFLRGDFDFQESMSLIYAPLSQRELRPIVWSFVQKQYGALTARLPKFWGRNLIVTGTAFCDDQHRQEAEAFFEDKIDAIPGGPRAFAQEIESMKLCIAYRNLQTPHLTEFLKNY